MPRDQVGPILVDLSENTDNEAKEHLVCGPEAAWSHVLIWHAQKASPGPNVQYKASRPLMVQKTPENDLQDP